MRRGRRPLLHLILQQRPFAQFLLAAALGRFPPALGERLPRGICACQGAAGEFSLAVQTVGRDLPSMARGLSGRTGLPEALPGAKNAGRAVIRAVPVAEQPS